MKAFCSSLIVYLRFTVRKKALIISVILLWLFSMIPYAYHTRMRDAMGLIHRSQYSQMACMFFFLILGLMLGQMEEREDCADVVQCSVRSPVVLIIAKIFFLWLVSTLYTLVMMLSTLLAFALMRMPWVVHFYGIKMLVTYFLIPTMACSIIGLAAGTQLHSRLKYAVLFVVWLLVSPISTEATAYMYGLFSALRPILRFVFSLINLGGRITWGDTPAYGIP